MKFIIETERLLLREFTTDDAEFIQQLMNTPGWLEFIGNRAIDSLAAAERYITDTLMPSYQTNGFGLWLVALRNSGTPVGMCGLVKRVSLEDIDIGFAFLPEYCGQGYARESAEATLRYCFDVLGLKQVAAITVPTNVRSIQVLERIGLSFINNIEHNGEHLLLFVVNAPKTAQTS